MKCYLEQRPGLEAPESREDKGIDAVSVTPPPVRGDLSLCRVVQAYHTTVTDFARARGLSILRPKARAV